MGGLGDRKPSVLMNEMLALMGDHRSYLLFEYTYLHQLRRKIHRQLLGESIEDPLRLVACADELWRADQQEVGVLETLDRINSAPWKAQHPRTTPTRGSTEPQTRQVAQEAGKKMWCSYHLRWWATARQCCQPCAFLGNSGAGRR